MTERMPQRKSLASNGARRNAPRGVTRPRPEETVQIAPENLVRKTIQLIENGTTFAQACGKMNISQAAWWRRVLHDPALKVELASLLMGTAWSRSDQFSAGGNAALVSVFAKFAKDTAASLAPQHFGEKVQVDSRQLVIHTNLDFSVCESLDGIVQGIATMAEVPLSPVEAQAEEHSCEQAQGMRERTSSPAGRAREFACARLATRRVLARARERLRRARRLGLLEEQRVNILDTEQLFW